MANKTVKLTKMDKYKMLSNLSAVKADPVLAEFVAHEMELLTKKNTAEKKPTAQQTANEGIKSAILDGMEKGSLYTVTDLIKTVPVCADLTNQRVSALLRQMVEDGKVVRTEDKRKAYFSKA